MDHGSQGHRRDCEKSTGLKAELHVGHNADVKNSKLDFEDILWLRRAATKAGALQVPPAVAEKLIGAGYVEPATKPPTLRITEKGRIALEKLG